jgi:hypothetical protein
LDQDELLWPSEVAAELGLGNPESLRTIRNRFQRGKVPDDQVFPPPVKRAGEHGHCTVYYRPDIHAWMIATGRTRPGQ